MHACPHARRHNLWVLAHLVQAQVGDIHLESVFADLSARKEDQVRVQDGQLFGWSKLGGWIVRKDK